MKLSRLVLEAARNATQGRPSQSCRERTKERNAELTAAPPSVSMLGAQPMRRRNGPALVAVLCCCVMAARPADSAQAADPPVRAEYLGSTEGKPPLKYHSVRLILTNRQDKA